MKMVLFFFFPFYSGALADRSSSPGEEQRCAIAPSGCGIPKKWRNLTIFERFSTQIGGGGGDAAAAAGEEVRGLLTDETKSFFSAETELYQKRCLYFDVIIRAGQR